MQRWTPQHAKFVGRVIFANFLSLPLENYESIIEEVEKEFAICNLQFAISGGSGRKDAAIRVRRLSRAKTFNDEKENRSSAVVAKIETRLRAPRLRRRLRRGERLRRGTRRENRFTLRYACEGFNKMYVIDNTVRDELATDSNIRSMLFRLRRISSRNALTHALLRGIIEHQGDFLRTGDAADLAPLSQVELTDWMSRGEGYVERLRLRGSYRLSLNGNRQEDATARRKTKRAAQPINEGRNTVISNSWLSRLVNGISVIIPSGEEKPLKAFFPTQKQINKTLIKRLLDKENEDLQSGELKKPYTDNELKGLLEGALCSRVTPKSRNAPTGQAVTKPVSSKGYGYVTEQRDRNGHPNRIRLPSISRHSVGHCRKDMGIPPAKRRLSGYKYPPLSANFSMLYPLTMKSIIKYAPAESGVYEFSVKRDTRYASRDTVFYIGSAMNLKKRLKEHLRANNKNGHIRDLLRKYECSFRYIQLSKNWHAEEKRLYKLFTDTYGSAPRCNRVKP